MDCPACGAGNRTNARFCDACGTPLPRAAEEHRKVVTVLFCDVVGSTALGETTDPEALRALLARYFERMRGIVEHHGGSVEKFVGDAVMAVFGVPAVHEDDALRACRAALEMRDAFPEVGVQGRIGVNSGEVVTGTEERLATGDALNVAARLQQAASPDEILMGEATLALVGGSVETAPADPVPAKGKARPVHAHRLLALGPEPRRPDPPFIGRREELAAVREAWERARRDRRCELVTIVGDAGVGKSRLVAEALPALGARAVHGRCPPYGEGVTYWPVAEVLEQLGTFPADPVAAESIRALLGDSERGTAGEEIAWAFRKLLEQEAPLVVVFDDIHNGEQTFLDLIEHVALLAADVPLLLLCMARPELADRRANWPVTLRLHPLEDEHVAELIGDRVPPELRERITRAAGGNPLFVLEMLAMTSETTEVEVPPSLRAVLASRLDLLETAERHVLERAAVEGEIFHRGAVQAMSPDEPDVTRRLASLVRRELVHPEHGAPGEDAFRFRHLLIRDAAYDGLPKAARAGLHERLADWLEEHGAGVPEPDELVGHHLEQAARFQRELGTVDPELAERAGERLAAAGRRALSRDDRTAAASLIERALVLTRPGRLDVALEAALANALGFDDAAKAIAVAQGAAERARAEHDEVGEAHAKVVSTLFRAWAGEIGPDELEHEARAALPTLERGDDHAGLAEAWAALFSVGNMTGHWADALAAVEQALLHARLSGRRQMDLVDWLATALVWGPTPAEEALDEIERRIPEPRSPYVLGVHAALLAMLDRYDEALPAAVDACARLEQQSGFPGDFTLGAIAMVAGRHETAARHFQAASRALEAGGATSLLGTCNLWLARSLCLLGRHDEAEPWADAGHLKPGDSPWLPLQVQALVHAGRGEADEAERLAREAVELVERTDSLPFQGDALWDLATVLEAAGRAGDAADAFEQALDRYERKQCLALASAVRRRLGALTPEPV